MEKNLLQGALVRLVAEEPEEHAEAISRWNCDTEWWRYLATELSNQHSVKKSANGLSKISKKMNRHCVLSPFVHWKTTA